MVDLSRFIFRGAEIESQRCHYRDHVSNIRRNHHMTAITYAIGDVHGEADRLRRLHELICKRHASEFGDASMTVIHLGDYVDRGPDSAGAIDAVMELSQDASLDVIALAGNHEAMLLAALAAPGSESHTHWLENGGRETMQSYLARGDETIPQAHIEWLRTRPAIHIDHSDKRVFVHAGVSPGHFPNEREEVYLWTRASAFFDVTQWQNTALQDWTVVHGHTPTRDGFPEIAGDRSQRINIDSGAVFGGRLTCAIFAPDQAVKFLYS